MPDWLGLRPGWQASDLAAGPPAWLAGLRPGRLGLRPGWMGQRGKPMDERTENLSILRDYVTN